MVSDNSTQNNFQCVDFNMFPDFHAILMASILAIMARVIYLSGDGKIKNTATIYINVQGMHLPSTNF